MFAAMMSPFVVDARSQLVSLAGRLPVGQHVDLDLVADEFGDQLGRRLARLAARTLVLELNLARTAGRLSGADGRARFVDFVRRAGRPASLASLFETYPVLARLLAEASRYAVEAHLELLSRFLADREEVVAVLLDGVDPGPVVGVAAGQGDLHRRGRSVAILSFARNQSQSDDQSSNQRLVYKPRSLAAHLQFTGFVEWLNEAVPGLGLKAARAIARADYGWSEFIAHRPLADLSGADRFYRRQGALLALLHVVHASDVHCENVIACGDLPVLVDTETLFHPTLAAPASGQDPAARTLAASVYRTGLLPKLVVGANGALDVSGLGGDHGQLSPNDAVDWEFPGTDQMRLTRRPATFAGACNRPRLGDRVIDPGDHEGALIEGFRLGYAAIMRGRREFTELVNRCAGTEVRVVIRPTRLYATLLDESTHPDLLRDALERDQVLDLLWADGSHPLPSHRLVRHELADLWAGDVPFFATRPEARDVWTSDGQRLPDVFDGAGLSRALDKLGAMSEADRRDQEWIISASLATRRPVDGHRSVNPAPGPVIGAAAEPSRLLAAACAVADQIVARGVTSQDRVNWLGLELVDDTHWLILPLGAGRSDRGQPVR
jgi:type 2 lantibiotic biosynthesis protein LanM